MSLVKNMNARKKAGISRSKKNSTVSPKAHKDMRVGWPKKKTAKNMNDNRLPHMEEMLDKLFEAVISMARIEDRMISVFKRLDRVDEGFNNSDKLIQKLEQTNIKLGQIIAFSERLFWVILTGSVSLVFVCLR